MRERAELLLKILCGVLIALLLYQTNRARLRSRPISEATIPALPQLATDTNAPGAPIASGADLQPAMAGPVTLPVATNKLETNLVATLPGTNSPSSPAVTHRGTNLPATFAVEKLATNAPGQTNAGVSTNALAQSKGPATTNAVASSTNLSAAAGHRIPHHSAGMPMMGMGFMPGMGGPGKPLPELPAIASARIDAIVNSELLGPVQHPLPKALLGIAGDTVFLRTDSGQTGLIKAGDSLGDIKLLRIGINRILIEQNGQKQELTIFDGMGGDSLLTTSDKNSNETTTH